MCVVSYCHSHSLCIGDIHSPSWLLRYHIGAMVSRICEHKSRSAGIGTTWGHCQVDNFSTGVHNCLYFLSIILPFAANISNRNNTCWCIRTQFRATRSSGVKVLCVVACMNYLLPWQGGVDFRRVIFIFIWNIQHLSQIAWSHDGVQRRECFPFDSWNGYADEPVLIQSTLYNALSWIPRSVGQP